MFHDVKTLISLALLGLALAGPARADWEFSQATDPMTDDQTGFVSVDNDEISFGLALKCWNDKEKTRWIAFVTNVDFDKAQKYPESTQISLRVDQEPVIDMTFGQVNFGNKLAYVTGPSFGDTYFAVEKKILNARSKIAASFMANLTVFNVANSRDVVRKLGAVCPYLRK